MHRFARPVLAALIGLASALGVTPSVQAADIGVYSGLRLFGRLRGALGARQDHQPLPVSGAPRAEPAQCRHHRFPEHPRASLSAGAGGPADRPDLLRRHRHPLRRRRPRHLVSDRGRPGLRLRSATMSSSASPASTAGTSTTAAAGSFADASCLAGHCWHSLPACSLPAAVRKPKNHPLPPAKLPTPIAQPMQPGAPAVPAASSLPIGEGFDFYVLSLSWSPSYCEAEGEEANRQQCGTARPYAFVVHGLWPQFERGFPESCRTDEPDVIERDAAHALRHHAVGRPHPPSVAASTAHVRGLDQDDYFAVLRAARETVEHSRRVPAPRRLSGRSTLMMPRRPS